MKFNIVRHETLDSTNTEAARQARLGAGEGLCIIAREQTAGRGRYGRTWVSQAGSGLYFSIILRPTVEPALLPLITLMAGVAVHDTIQTFGVDPDIKWVNDVLVREKKVSGILAETVETPTGVAVVVGIGINLLPGNLPPDISQTATSLEAEKSIPFTADEVVNVLTANISQYYDILNVNGEAGRIIELWQARSTYYRDKDVRVTVGNEVITGTTDGLEPNGALRVKTADGSIKIVQAGDVERLRTNIAEPQDQH